MSPVRAPMKGRSDLDAASRRLARVAGAAAMERELRTRGLRATQIAPEHWEPSTTTAPELALLPRSLDRAERLGPMLRARALMLMGSGVSEQRRGVPPGLPPGAAFAFEGDRAPRDDGRRLHHLGRTRIEGRSVLFAFLNRAQPSFEYGWDTLEGAVSPLGAASGERPR